MKLLLKILIIYFITYTNKIIAQPCTIIKELNRKRHKIEGSTYGHPYTTFDRHNGIGFQKTIENIRKKIIEESPENVNGPIYSAYKLLYIFASKPMPTDNGMHNESPSELALWAKNNAFVMLIGLDENGNTLTISDRENRKNNVLHAFNNLSANITYTNSFGIEDKLSGLNPFGSYIPTNVLTILQSFEKKIILSSIQHYSRSLILWLQAYDLLKASAALAELDNIKYFNNYDSDANKDWCSPRNKLRHLSRDLYQMSKGWLGIVAFVTT